jgi:saccharopine dehydrogenase-like NADP-dependent oxidoreductase
MSIWGQVRQLLRRSDQGRVVATCRAPGSAAELQKLKEEHAPGRLTVLPLDVTDETTIEVRYTRSRLHHS